MRLARSLALARAGSSIAARIAMMAITTSTSIRVNPAGGRHGRCRAGGGDFGSACRCILVIGPHGLRHFVVHHLQFLAASWGPGYHSGPPDPSVYENHVTTRFVLCRLLNKTEERNRMRRDRHAHCIDPIHQRWRNAYRLPVSRAETQSKLQRPGYWRPGYDDVAARYTDREWRPRLNIEHEMVELGIQLRTRARGVRRHLDADLHGLSGEIG